MSDVAPAKFVAKYQTFAELGGPAHGASRVAQADLVVQSMGHMRAFSGHAFVPGMLPAGVAESDLQ